MSHPNTTPRIGAKITFRATPSVLSDAELAHVRVVDVLDGGATVRRENDALFAYIEYTHEGITWIRGWHAPDSVEAQALLAAWLLVQPFQDAR